MADYKIMDGCTAATYVAYALSEVGTIYPISPLGEMGEIANHWAMKGIKNVFGTTMSVEELESELGAAGATHGALVAGSLATTFTCSQGLMLMIPNMYKISGELLPGVFHVGTRSLASHALSIFGDHQDVMAVRATGFALLASASVQEALDLAIVAHLAAIDGRVPVVHYMDGWRTANEMTTISVPTYDEIKTLVNWDAIKAFRSRAMNPEHPDLRGSAQNPDVYFQNREAANKYYDAFPRIVQEKMDMVAKLTGRQYHLFDYCGPQNPDTVIISMCSSVEVECSTLDYLNSNGYNVGVIKVRLYRPFSAEKLMEAIPASVKNIVVLDRTKEPGCQGEPLYLDVATAVLHSGRNIRVIGGRYGLSSKEFDPSMVLAVVKNAQSANPINGFTVGITDDVTHLSLPVDEHVYLDPGDMNQAIFFGIGADGTVGATKMAASIFGNTKNLFAQAFFSYSAKKSGGYTRSQLRISSAPIHMEYSIEEANYVGCNKNTYINTYPLVDDLKPGGIFVLNSPWDLDQLEKEMSADLKRKIFNKKIKFYNVDAIKIAQECGLGVRINTIMLTVYFKLNPIIDFDTAVNALKSHISTTYMHEGGQVVQQNLKAVDMAADAITQIDYPDSWATTTEGYSYLEPVPPFIDEVARPCMSLNGNDLPVSLMQPDGTMPMGTTAYEKRRIAINVPQWNIDKCIECTECSLVCPHAAIRPVLLDATERSKAPQELTSKPEHAPALKDYQLRIQVYTEDCTGCSSCSLICPGHALDMMPIETQLSAQIPLLDYVQKNISIKDNVIPRTTINGSQFCEPMLEFSGACAGCGETPYVKLVTQLFGERMIIANATGCSSIWGANFPSNAYCTNRHGQGAAWGNSLFEDNAEYGYGMAIAISHRRDQLTNIIKSIISSISDDSDAVKTAATQWMNTKSLGEESKASSKALLDAIKNVANPTPDMQYVVENADLLVKKSIWCIGGDGWAYDIGFAGLDHVVAQNVDINILVLDTECYSNTGGQTSKATPLGAVAKYSEDGKRTNKKNLGRMLMSYDSVYVASVALGANYVKTIQALVEAESYPGPSVVICYCPCIEHGIQVGLGHSILVEKAAVESGYWSIYRFDPRRTAAGKNPLVMDCAEPVKDEFLGFINGENRYADLRMIDPAEAAILQPELHDHADLEYAMLAQQSQMPLPPSVD